MQHDIARIVTFSLGVCLDARFSHQQKCNCAVAYAAAALVRLAEDWKTFFFIVGLDTLFVFKNCGFSGEPKAGPGSPTLVP